MLPKSVNRLNGHLIGGCRDAGETRVTGSLIGVARSFTLQLVALNSTKYRQKKMVMEYHYGFH